MDEFKIKIKTIAIMFFCCYALVSCFASTVKAEDITTGNLLPNGTGAASNLQSVDTTVPNVQSSCSSFTSVNTTCTNSNWNYQEVEVGSTSSGTGTLNYQGNLVGVQTGDETSTQAMLDNGVTLDSTTIIQNCEWSGSSSSCGQAQSGRDTFKTTVKILDSDGNMLSQVDQIRNTDAGYYANAHKYTDQVIYNSAGPNKFDWTWTGIDGDSTPVNLGGPNLLGAKLTMTYDNTVLEESTSTALTNLQEELAEFEEEVIEFIVEEEIEVAMEVEEMEETFSFTPMLMVFEEEEESIIEETPITTSFFSVVTQEEEIYEETEEITASFLPMVSQEEEMVQEEEEIIEESPIMESAQEEVIEEEETVAKGPMKMVQNTHEEKEEKAIEEKEEIKEEKEEKVKEESKVAEKKEAEEKEVAEEESSSESTTEVSSANTSEQKKIQQKKALVKNIDRVMDKVDSEIKDVAKNLQIKNIIKLEAMASEQASLDLYANAAFYKPKDIYLEQLNIFDNRQIYANVSLASYVKNDKVAIKANTLHKINLKKQRLLKELELLKNGKI